MASLLFNPSDYDPTHLDEATRANLLELIAFFEGKGLAEMKADFHQTVWYADFLDRAAQLGTFGRFGTPAEVGELTGDAEARWDTHRINELNEILAFYSLSHWYAWQVTVLGLGPVWTSDNAAAKELVGGLLADGAVFGFGLSEKTHGADIYSTDMILTRDGDGWLATGPKYYIGNGNVAGRLSVFGRFADDDPEFPGEYVFFLVDPAHPAYQLEKNVVSDQMYVSAFSLADYPVAAADILHTGKPAWDAALATVNVGKANLGWASIGICEHAFYESVAHANNRVLYGTRVTDFPHVRRMLADAYARLLAMKIFAARATDYMRTASDDDRRFLLFNPLTKMKVTGEGEKVIDLLWDVIAARGFENDTYFEQAAQHIRALPKLEGTVAVNVALVLKFLPQYLLAATGAGPELPVIGVVDGATDDAYLFAQGPASGLGRIGFHDPQPAFARFAHLPNVAIFVEQMKAFAELVTTAPPTEDQSRDLDYLQSLGQLFTQIVYAQLVCEGAALALDADGVRAGGVGDLTGLTEDHVNRMFAVFVQDLDGFALELFGRASATAEQREKAQAMVAAPDVDATYEKDFVAEVLSYDGAYTMNP
ncbi:MAG: acyl-CoA dehydrogenase [Actinobacteria bacterium]|nr:MAG: acyl-CoA dehydrogenase [Actinomycetota bacterium]